VFSGRVSDRAARRRWRRARAGALGQQLAIARALELGVEGDARLDAPARGQEQRVPRERRLDQATSSEAGGSPGSAA
jgi:hypothetical protein